MSFWRRYCQWRELSVEQSVLVSAPYYDDGLGRSPRYYQINAINSTVEAVVKGQQRILLVMATGTGKTYTALSDLFGGCGSLNKRSGILFFSRS
jgi:type I restriction enzyme R subunit